MQYRAAAPEEKSETDEDTRRLNEARALKRSLSESVDSDSSTSVEEGPPPEQITQEEFDKRVAQLTMAERMKEWGADGKYADSDALDAELKQQEDERQKEKAAKRKKELEERKKKMEEEEKRAAEDADSDSWETQVRKARKASKRGMMAQVKRNQEAEAQALKEAAEREALERTMIEDEQKKRAADPAYAAKMKAEEEAMAQELIAKGENPATAVAHASKLVATRASSERTSDTGCDRFEITT